MIVVLLGVVFLGLAPILLVAATVGDIPQIAIGFLLMVFVSLGVTLARISPRHSLHLLTATFAFQAIILLMLSKFLDSYSIKLMLGAKELLTATLLVVLALRFHRRYRFTATDGGALLFLGIYAVYFVLPGAGYTFAKLVSFREPFMVVALYALGRFLGTLGVVEVQRYLRFVVLLALVVAGFGYVERFLFSPEIWNALGATSFIDTKLENARFSIPFYDGLPATWWTYIGGGVHRRMVATIVDAPSLSRFLALPVLYLGYRLLLPGARSLPLHGTLLLPGLTVLVGALLLTLGRGGIVIVGIGVIALLVNQRRVFTAGLLALALAVSLATVLDLNQANIDRHITGLTSGFTSVSVTPLGHGLGTSGQLAAAYAGENIRWVAEESYVGSLMAQLGIPGAVGYFMFFALLAGSTLRSLRASVTDPEHTLISLLAFSGVVGIFTTSFVANSAVSPISAGPFLIVIGSSISLSASRTKGPSFQSRSMHTTVSARG